MSYLAEQPEKLPIAGFSDVSKSIAEYIKNSSNVCIGILGNWGIGKTTLMNTIYEILREKILIWENVNFKNYKELQKLNLDTKNLMNFLKNRYNWLNNESNYNINIEKNLITISNSKNYITIQLRHNNKLLNNIFKKNKENQNEVLKNVEIKANELVTSLKKHQSLIIRDDTNNEEEFIVMINENQHYIYLNNESFILPIWFDAWRYEREIPRAPIALMNTIIKSIESHPIFLQLKPDIASGLVAILKGYLIKFGEQYIKEENIIQAEKYFTRLGELKVNEDSSNSSVDWIAKTEQKLSLIRQNYKNCLIVIFIDDLDRCSPETVLELLESLKVFFSMKGFVFVVGLNDKLIIDIMRKILDNRGVTGEDLKDLSTNYINKFIQINYVVPQWRPNNIYELINNLCENYLLPSYFLDIEKEYQTFSSLFQLNPRAIKQFILTHQLLKNILALPEKKEYLIASAIIYNVPDKILFIETIRRVGFKKFLQNLSLLDPTERSQVIL